MRNGIPPQLPPRSSARRIESSVSSGPTPASAVQPEGDSDGAGRRRHARAALDEVDAGFHIREPSPKQPERQLRLDDSPSVRSRSASISASDRQEHAGHRGPRGTPTTCRRAGFAGSIRTRRSEEDLRIHSAACCTSFRRPRPPQHLDRLGDIILIFSKTYQRLVHRGRGVPYSLRYPGRRPGPNRCVSATPGSANRILPTQ